MLKKIFFAILVLTFTFADAHSQATKENSSIKLGRVKYSGGGD